MLIGLIWTVSHSITSTPQISLFLYIVDDNYVVSTRESNLFGHMCYNSFLEGVSCVWVCRNYALSEGLVHPNTMPTWHGYFFFIPCGKTVSRPSFYTGRPESLERWILRKGDTTGYYKDSPLSFLSELNNDTGPFLLVSFKGDSRKKRNRLILGDRS